MRITKTHARSITEMATAAEPTSGHSTVTSAVSDNIPMNQISSVRRGGGSATLRSAPYYLLIEPNDSAEIRDHIIPCHLDEDRPSDPGLWLINPTASAYGERVSADGTGRLIRIERYYPQQDAAPEKVAIVTNDRGVAAQWARAKSRTHGRHLLESAFGRHTHSMLSPHAKRQLTRSAPWGKRAFDIVFSLVALLVTAPIWLLIMVAIWLEDGWPIFFVHRRQSIGGHEFGCIKFRVMHRDAERRKSALAPRNESDGPQFHLSDDPRLLRVGRLLRRWSLDELPQFLNVLIGDMSIVGPRPSPDKENQYCPAWREARLSVRPGLTGLWQVRRTRKPNTDFQEWIRFDLEYVQRQRWMLDLWIIAITPLAMLCKPARQDPKLHTRVP